MDLFISLNAQLHFTMREEINFCPLLKIDFRAQQKRALDDDCKAPYNVLVSDTNLFHDSNQKCDHNPPLGRK